MIRPVAGITEAGQKVDAKAFQRPRVAVRGSIRRRLKRGQANITRLGRLLHRNENMKDHPEAGRRDLWLTRFMRDGNLNMENGNVGLTKALGGLLLLHSYSVFEFNFPTLYPLSEHVFPSRLGGYLSSIWIDLRYDCIIWRHRCSATCFFSLYHQPVTLSLS